MGEWIVFSIFVLILIVIFVKFQYYKKLGRLFRRKSENTEAFTHNRHYDFNLIGKYYHNIVKYKQFYHIINDKLANDFDINELFKKIDYTTSKIGQQYFYAKLRTIENKEKLHDFEQLIENISKDNNVNKRIQSELNKLSNDELYYFEELIHGVKLKKPHWLKFLKLSTFIFISILILAVYNPLFLFVLIPLYIAQMILHYKNKMLINHYLIAVSDFNRCLHTALNISKLDEIKSSYYDFDFLSSLNKISKRIRFISFENSLNNDFLSAIWAIFELFKVAFNIEILMFYSFIDELIKERKNIHKLFAFIGNVDSAMSVSMLRENNTNWCKPIFEQKKELELKNITHPLIDNCVPNTINLSHSSLLLTGSNMSGKTTFIRAIGVNSVLAQTLNTCFADEYKAPFLKLYSSIRISDSILNNTSYYLEEVLTIKQFVDIADKSELCLFVMDEIFKGTNTSERISAANAILQFLNSRNHIVLVSTHDIELSDLLVNSNFDLHHFSEQIHENKLIFDHKLKQGKLKTRNAIKILELYNYPAEILQTANNNIERQ